MSKPKQPPVKRDFTKKKKKVKQARKELRKRRLAQGIENATGNSSVSNRMSAYTSIEDEREDRQKAISNQVQVYRSQLKTIKGSEYLILEIYHPVCVSKLIGS